MVYNLVTNIKSCYTDIPGLLYYSHIPPAIIVLLLGIFVLFKSKENRLAGKVLFSISILFSAWVITEGTIWLVYSSAIMMPLWSVLGVLYVAIHIMSLYFVYAVIDKKDISSNKKYILSFLLLPMIILTPTRYNLTGFDAVNCQAMEGNYFIGYRYLLGIILIIWILALLYSRYKKAQQESKKQILLIGFGVLLFLLLFSWSEISGSITQNFEITQYGLFGMPVFMAFLVYLIIKYKAFNIKLLVAQALVVSIIILIASQFAFIQDSTNRILTVITLAIVSVFGWWLAKSVKKENEQNELLKQSNKIIAEQKDKIEKDKEIVERANEELKRLDKAKTEFINIASHQLRTPISVISGVASMMLEGDMEKMPMEQKQKFYQSVWEKAKKLKIIVHDILNATSFANKKYSIMDQSAEPVNVPELIGQIVKDFEMEVKERDIDLTLSSEKNIPDVKGQKEYLEEAFINLINNAIKYTPSSKITNDVRGKREGNGRGKVAVSVKKDPKNPENILIEVKDNGIGIPEDAKAKLFQRFSRAQNAVNMYTDGTGLGLFIVKEIAEGHGGKVWFESELNKGTTFFVSLPVNPESDVNIKNRITQDAESNSEVKF